MDRGTPIIESIPDAVVRHAGLVMMQLASIASNLEDGALVCPFAVVTKGTDRQSIAFESETQDEAVAKGWASLEQWKSNIDLWALAREGLVKSPRGKDDVLLVAAWTFGMAEPAMFTQRYERTERGFRLPGPVAVDNLAPSAIKEIGEAFAAGIDEHPNAHFWNEWKACSDEIA